MIYYMREKNVLFINGSNNVFIVSDLLLYKGLYHMSEHEIRWKEGYHVIRKKNIQIYDFINAMELFE